MAQRKTAPSKAKAPAVPEPRAEVPGGGFPIVGLGASAGGLGAFEAFFSGMPADAPGMAFVLVQHLAPDHESILVDLIQRCTTMKVFEVVDGMKVQANCVYIIPPNRDLAFQEGALRLLECGAPRGQRLPIDFFFRSLAAELRERAIGIILSGTGSDGTQGVKAIKAEGGMVMAQAPSTTEYDGMPSTALATGLVDYELPPGEMPAQLALYIDHAFFGAPALANTPKHRAEAALKRVFALLRAHTGHDFSKYKPSTIHRRIDRRMAVNMIKTMEAYLKFLQQVPTELDALFRDLLIGVTNFFRDPEAFQALEEKVIPRLFEGKAPGDPIRVWVPGCSTGEEAYSIAILLQERLEALKQSYAVQVFATDIDSQAIASARAGLFPYSIANDVSPERLARFFTPEPDGSAFRIHKAIRDMLIISEQDLIKDPPFSRLDLLSCRNLLIYLGPELQKKVVPLFHYALNPGGMLFLGSSESVGEFTGLFSALDRKQKLYQSAQDLHAGFRPVLGRLPAPLGTLDAALARATGKQAGPLRMPVREMTERALLQFVSPAGVLVDAQGDVLYLHGRTGLFLEPAPGEAGVSNLLKMAREGLRRDLAMALQKAASTKEPVTRRDLRVRTNGHFTMVDLAIHPLAPGQNPALDQPLFLVVFTESPKGEAQPAPSSPASDERVDALLRELRAKEDYLQSVNEEMETSNEELKSSNEEMQSVNEELQSTNEELETSKEELQSVNEELATVNTELQTKVADLSRAYNDMNNLLAGTGIATIFVDHQLKLMRFTPAATGIINLILGDLGRPVGHILSNLVGYTSLEADTRSVLASLVPREIEVSTVEGRWFTLRIQPYRTLDHVIEGAVITFVDITEMRKAKEDLEKANALLRRRAARKK